MGGTDSQADGVGGRGRLLAATGRVEVHAECRERDVLVSAQRVERVALRVVRRFRGPRDTQVDLERAQLQSGHVDELVQSDKAQPGGDLCAFVRLRRRCAFLPVSPPRQLQATAHRIR